MRLHSPTMAAACLRLTWRACLRACILTLTSSAALLLVGCATQAPGAHGSAAADTADPATWIIVAVDEAPEVRPAAGSTPRPRYGRTAGYAGSTRAAATAEAVAASHGLHEEAVWSIAPLRLRCMLYRLPAGSDRQAVLARLQQDPRVALAQPLAEFQTFDTAVPAARPVAPYDDPYFRLQRGLVVIQAEPAQRWSQGEGVRVAVIDTGIDARHPDLAGRIADERDFVGSKQPPAARGEAHGTEMAGVIAAVARNRTGIVGVAPQARLLAYRACWPVAEGGARCNSFTLAQAIAAAIAAGSDVINLSLGGPADPLLQRLVTYALQRGTIVVGALPPNGRLDGFPAGVPGVLVVGSSDEALPAGAGRAVVLTAPGRDILTLAPGGTYGYASGSSLSAAHVSGAMALLRALQPGLRGDAVGVWWQQPVAGAAGRPIDICRAVRHVSPESACTSAD